MHTRHNKLISVSAPLRTISLSPVVRV